MIFNLIFSNTKNVLFTFSAFFVMEWQNSGFDKQVEYSGLLKYIMKIGKVLYKVMP